ncbi:hypothetical protein N431DRAFT_429881 [Stipitochalara longipes BDJ]|nr:hypothetical protein N431DRAFT_429881 [Stipitochalara longipes BDJ]
MIEQVYVILHGRLSEWFFEKGVAPSVVSRLTPRSYYDVTFQAIKNKNWEILWDWIAAHVDGPSHLLGPAPSIDDSKITEELHIMTALLLGMTDTSGPGSFPREKIAILKDGALMLVPQCARAGDLVCQFCPDPKPWVIRKLQPGNRVELDAKLLKYFKRLSWSGFQGSIAWLGRSDKNPYTAESALSVLSCRSVEHFNFIGSCRPEPKFPDGTPEYERHTSIFALH